MTIVLKLFPVALWLLMLGSTGYHWAIRSEERGLQLFFLAVMSVVCPLMFRSSWKLMDRVTLASGELRLVRRGIQQRVPLTDVLNVSQGTPNIPTMVTVRLRSSGTFGDEVRFAARLASKTWWSRRLLAVEELISAVDVAKSGSRT